MTKFLSNPWPWYVAGPLIGLMVPLLLLLGNKTFGISSSLRHICAAIIPAKIPFFKYDWKRESWNLVFVLGIVVGAFIASSILQDPNPIHIHPRLAEELGRYGINDFQSQVPVQLFSWSQVFTLRGFMLMVVGGFLVGFGTRYAGGCTSGHSITGLSSLQWPSLVATVFFMIGGFLMANLLLPIILTQ